MLRRTETIHECIQVHVPWRIFFTIDKQAHSVQNNPGYDAVSSCNCTSNIVIMNVVTVYDIIGLIWKHEVHIWTHGCLYDIKAVLIIILNVSSFKIHRVLFIYSISLIQTTTNVQKLPN
jgi:hypothetical protein